MFGFSDIAGASRAGWANWAGRWAIPRRTCLRSEARRRGVGGGRIWCTL